LAQWNDEWSETDLGRAYGKLFYQRAVGELPEMESSKAAAARILEDFNSGETLLDVGCGAGHYLTSLRRQGATNLSYTGLDATSEYVELARKAFAADANASFAQGDIFALPYNDGAFDVVMCNNVLLHLPTIAKPLAELVRVARRRVLVRTLVGQKSYVVKDVAPQPDGDDFDAAGEPRAFHFLNIYSQDYVRKVLQAQPRVRTVAVDLDRNYSAAAVSDTADHLEGAWDATRVVAGMQAAGAILLPWSFIDARLGA
jgi:ubiquinone/menaquinone biosynthesis C-methylase UbiE